MTHSDTGAGRPRLSSGWLHDGRRREEARRKGVMELPGSTTTGCKCYLCAQSYVPMCCCPNMYSPVLCGAPNCTF